MLMAARFCPFCGQPVVANATFCSSCGASLGGALPSASPPGTVSPPLAYPGPTPYAPYAGTYLPTARPTPTSTVTDQSALSRVTWAALLGLVGALLSFVELFFTRASSFVAVSGGGSNASFSLDLSALYLAVALGGVGVFFALVELGLLRVAFRTLASHDGRFSTPSKLVLLAIVALILLVVIGFAILAVLYAAIACAGTGHPITTACINLGNLLGLLALFVIVGIVLLVGYIGLLIGIWRLGTRYDEAMFKVGGILLIFPVLNIVALILILVAARSAREKLGRPSFPPTFG